MQTWLVKVRPNSVKGKIILYENIQQEESN